VTLAGCFSFSTLKINSVVDFMTFLAKIGVFASFADITNGCEIELLSTPVAPYTVVVRPSVMLCDPLLKSDNRIVIITCPE
jgi:hypothetical protein